MSQKILIHVIKNENQRYPTVGDWEFGNDNNLVIRVSNLGNDLEGTKMNCLIAIHELVEALLCKFNLPEIMTKQVDSFDMSHPELDEPGDDPRAPYYSQHDIATTFERIFAIALKVNWESYEKRIKEL
jgi:hypothetical protein